MRVLRVYHSGRNAAERARERALVDAGVALTLVVPAAWPEPDADPSLSEPCFEIIELPVVRAGDINRHRYQDSGAVERTIRSVKPDVLDIHEEPFSLAGRQWLAAAPSEVPVVMYAAQNVDKRLPPPFSTYERRAHARVAALYPCSKQAASVARGKGFAGVIEIIPLGYDPAVFRAGTQRLQVGELVLGLFGRLVREKGPLDAVRVLSAANAIRPTRLILAGEGTEGPGAFELASALGVGERLEIRPWRSLNELASTYRQTHIVLVPSTATMTWVEQFGRVIVEAQASGAVVAGYASGAIAEVVAEAGVLVPEGDSNGLTARVAELIGRPDEYDRLRADGLALAQVRTWDSIASRHASLYELVASGAGRVRLPRDPAARRAAARDEFGPTASTLAGERPFALPALRRGGLLARLLASAVDLVEAVRSRVFNRRSDY
jgi:glycosyltransferase involved in cell wall biosynthesis